ncbi:MAG: hypothetical protein HYU86_07170 [Chloroflexi bacterium]|nr:hypothetical protein [Chloroflexota bacterium]
MERYIIELPHTNEECLRALDETKERARELLPLIDWGCDVGNHKGWVALEARSQDEALSKVESPFLREKAFVCKVVKYTPKQIESFHKM